MKLFQKTEEFSEGKFLVTRRDGSTPDWPHFVMGARDPAVPPALETYAREAETIGLDPEYVASVFDLATDFRLYRQAAGIGDPDAPPHRIDSPTVLKMMRHEVDVAAVIKLLSAAGSALRSYQHGNTAPDLAQYIADAVDALLGPAIGPRT